MSQRIIVVEPSPFRRAETYVIGPFGRFKSWRLVNGALQRMFPFGAFTVLPETAKVSLGDRQLWPRVRP